MKKRLLKALSGLSIFPGKINFNGAVYESQINRLRDDFTSFQGYKYAFERLNHLPCLNSDQQIMVLDTKIPFADIATKKDLRPTKVNSAETVHITSCGKHEILFLTCEISNWLIRCDFHFFYDQLFLYRYKFPYLNSYSKKRVLDMYMDKYLPANTEVPSAFKYAIKDSKNAVIHIEDGYNMTVNYLLYDNFDIVKKFFEEHIQGLNQVSLVSDHETTISFI